jgi:branched-chain amino acid transport system permease protein
MTLLGGTGVFWGPAAGAVALVWLHQEIAAVTRYWPFVLGVILLGLLFVFPSGIAGAVDAARRRVQRRVEG